MRYWETHAGRRTFSCNAYTSIPAGCDEMDRTQDYKAMKPYIDMQTTLDQCNG